MIRQMAVVDRNMLDQKLKRLKLGHIREILKDANELAMEEEPSYVDFLGYLVNWEIELREKSQKIKRMKKAKFPQVKTLEQFDFSYQTSINQQSLLDLAELGFIEAKENIIFLGPSGVGKSHLSIALGVAAVAGGYTVRFFTFTDLVDELYSALVDGGLSRKIDSILKSDIIILDELGYVSMDATASDHIFQFIAQAYEKRSLILTSNLNFEEWGALFSNTSTAAAVLDRLLHHAHVFNLKGDSYRIRNRLIPPSNDKEASE